MVNLEKDKTVSAIFEQFSVKNSRAKIIAGGSWGAFTNLAAVKLAEHTRRPILLIAGHIEQADDAGEDIRSFSDVKLIELAAYEDSFNKDSILDEAAAERLKAAAEIKANLDKPIIVSTSIQGLRQPIFDIEDESCGLTRLCKGQTIEPELVESALIDEGFERVDCVDIPGQFARRGGIIDIFAPLASYTIEDKKYKRTSAVAVRIDFFGDSIESMRLINLDNQHSLEEINSFDMFSGNCSRQTPKTLFDIISKDTIVVFNDLLTIQETAEILEVRTPPPSPEFKWKQLYQRACEFAVLEVNRFAAGTGGKTFQLPVSSVEQYKANRGAMWSGHKQQLLSIVEQARQGKDVLLFCESAANRKRVREIISEQGIKLPRKLKFFDTTISAGFEITTLKTIIISHHEIFGQDTLTRSARSIKPAAPIDNFLDLSKGDYVVHITHGIGRFEGIRTIEKNGEYSEYLTIEFADNVRVHTSVNSINLVHKYIGTAALKPNLSKIGTKSWSSQKQKVADSVEDMAAELLELQARRERLEGIQFEDDNQWQFEFEQAFPYQETPDQITAADQIKESMTLSKPMDMLLCGDVGYGKTELAMRAAFRAVQSGKQTAVLVPTTVLSVQHCRTFNERFADFPVNIEVINRFKSPGEAKDILKRLNEGKIDILIGTHRLLSKDVKFNDLGFLIIDEEQRFGVAHKEKLKKMRTNIDILTMTATPIPRTLHFSLLGLRDIASLTTAPLDRRSISTNVSRKTEQVLRTAVNRELNREGQIFFLHNRVKTIQRAANELRAMFPKATISIAHGQMSKYHLEKAMLDFVSKKTDILVCTTIIESGLDIPSANTIIIDNADTFGLAQLHQLRGRVGRYKYRAYAQLLLPPNRPIKPQSAKRLKAIEEFSQLGAGFKIALRDLEIRGAGNILGPEQSGHINLVGYELYCKLLSDAVKRLKNEPVEIKPQTILNLGFMTNIPKSYIPSDRQRLAAYRKIASAGDVEDVQRLQAELKDIFGTPPEEVMLLLETAEIRIRAAKQAITSIEAANNKLIFTFDKKQIDKTTSPQPGALFKDVKGKLTIPDPHTVHLKLSDANFESKSLLAKLRKILTD